MLCSLLLVSPTIHWSVDSARSCTFRSHPRRERSTNTRARIRTPTTRTMTSIYWLFVVGLFASTCRHCLCAALNWRVYWISCRCCVGVWMFDPSRTRRLTIQCNLRIRCQIFHIFLVDFQKISINFAQPWAPKPAPTFFPSHFPIHFFAFALVARSTVDTLFIIGEFDLYTDTHAPRPELLWLLHMRRSLACGALHTTRRNPLDIGATPAHPHHISESLRDTERYVL